MFQNIRHKSNYIEHIQNCSRLMMNHDLVLLQLHRKQKGQRD